MINFAIVGCGHIAKKHAMAISKLENANLLAVCDKVSSTMSFYNEEYGAQTFTELKNLLSLPYLDVVCICTPSGFHATLATQIAEAGKHIIVEKPIALTLEDADVIIESCKENNVKLAVVHPNRFRPVVQVLKPIIESGDFGKLSHANATVRWNRNQEYYDQAAWRGTKSLDGGVLMNQAIHNLDLLLWLMGDVEEVFSMAATRLREIEAEDVSTGLIRFKNGALGVVEAATTIYPKNLEETISIFGEKGTVKIGGTTASLFEHFNIEGIDEEESNSIIEKVKQNPIGKPGHECIIEDMVEAIQYDREPIVNGLDGKKALQLVLAFYASSEKDAKILLENQHSLLEVK